MEYKFVPIAEWPGSRTSPVKRRRAQFSTTYPKTLQLLDRELEHLGARSVVIQLALDESEIRLDGKPRAGANPRHPGVVLSFTAKEGPLSFPCDTFTDWRDNLRAISLTLEKLRAIDRYGVTKRGEQYRGWRALPPATTVDSRQEAAEFLARHSTRIASQILANENARETAYREAAGRLHPDRGGSHELFVELQRAIAALRRRAGDAA
jgi:hypothetical protein